jgi:predicted DNA-binding transcriptional regulator AlpA
MTERTGYFLRLNQIVRTSNADGSPLLPISKSTWWAGVRSGKFPAPVKLGPRTTAWRSSDISELIEKLGAKR